MSVALYDRAVRDKIAGWVVDPNITIYSPDEIVRLFQNEADMLNDKPIKLPLIAISRGRDIEIQSTNKKPLTYMGKTFNATYDAADHLNAVPCTIGYQIDIYTRYQAEADEYVRNFVFNIINFPAMEIEIPYNGGNNSYISYLSLLSPIRDNSDIPERLVAGQFTRVTINVALKDAQLFSYNHKLIPRITNIEINPVLKYRVELELDKDINIKEKNTMKFSKNSIPITIREEEEEDKESTNAQC